MCISNVLGINKIPAQLLVFKVSPQNYPSVLCGLVFLHENEVNFSCPYLLEDLIVSLRIWEYVSTIHRLHTTYSYVSAALQSLEVLLHKPRSTKTVNISCRILSFDFRFGNLYLPSKEEVLCISDCIV